VCVEESGSGDSPITSRHFNEYHLDVEGPPITISSPSPALVVVSPTHVAPTHLPNRRSLALSNAHTHHLLQRPSAIFIHYLICCYCISLLIYSSAAASPTRQQRRWYRRRRMAGSSARRTSPSSRARARASISQAAYAPAT